MKIGKIEIEITVTDMHGKRTQADDRHRVWAARTQVTNYRHSRKRFTVFHRTTDDNANVILRNGFRDTTDDYGIAGVWLSDRPLDCNEGAWGDAILCIDGLTEELLDEFEWVEEGKPYREWLVPAELLNSRGKTSRYVEPDDYVPEPPDHGTQRPD